MVKIRAACILVSILALASCKTAPPPPTDDTLITSEVDGVTLLHRYAIQPPAQFTPVNGDYRALYTASVMSRPDFGGSVVQQLENGAHYRLLGEVENQWYAVADAGASQLLGYVPRKALVSSDRYAATLRSDRPRPRRAVKKECVDVGGQSKACRSHASSTWILE
ncbi:SH3 domain-containing protein [Pantoea sp. 1.19]|uniref:SH3 domain-containing protein n=1 Tax=Pantoea sp. 1.19 TaxID=1925589 RepID=UPI003529EC92